MAAVVVDNTCQVRITWSNSGTPFAVNVCHGIKDDPLASIDAAKAQSLANAMSTRFAAMSGATKNALRNTITLSQVGIRDLNSANNPEYIATPATAFAYTGISELLPLNVAACVTLRTAKAGASYRGRMYITGWGEGVSTEGVMAATATTGAVEIVNAVKAALKDAGLTMSVASRKLGKSSQVTSVLSRDNRWDTQRRRIVAGI